MSVIQIIKVASKSAPSEVAGAIAGTLRKGHDFAVQSIGPEALTRSVTALMLASRFMAQEGRILSVQIEAFQIRGDYGDVLQGFKFTPTATPPY
jgi:stage V sporulation protein SpoVS